MKRREPRHVLFLCIGNRTRSVFAELFFRKLLKDHCLTDEITVTSAGFILQRFKDQLSELHIGFPEPFYTRPIAEATRTVLLTHAITVPDGWRSQEVSAHMVESADLIITALPEQKEDLAELYPHALHKIQTIREISRWDGYLLMEDFNGYPLDDRLWDYIEEDLPYVSAMLSKMERLLIRAVPYVLERLGQARGPEMTDMILEAGDPR